MIKKLYHSNLGVLSGWISGNDARPYALDADFGQALYYVFYPEAIFLSFFFEG